jgi:pimeloyl-ACP methyl ester carboxylesterase
MNIHPNTSGTIKLSDAELYYEIYGSGRPLLMLHGNGQSISAFSEQIPVLAKRFRVIAVDTRGQGNSTDSSTAPLTYELFADDMKHLLDALNIPKVNILGWSDGGNTGLIMAFRYPGYVNKLAVSGAVLFSSDESIDPLVFEHAKNQLGFFGNKTDAASKMQVRLFKLMIDEPNISFEQLHSITAKVLVMAGEHDIVLEKHTRAIAHNILNSELRIFKDGSHFIPLENAAEFNAAVICFFES